MELLNKFLLTLVLGIFLIIYFFGEDIFFYWFWNFNLISLYDINMQSLLHKNVFFMENSFKEFKQILKTQGVSAFVYSPGGVLNLMKLKASMQHFYLYCSPKPIAYLWDDLRGNPTTWSWWQFEFIKKQAIQINNLEFLNKRQKQEILALKEQLKNISDLK